MTKHIALIQGHPDAKARHLGHALADAYAQGAADGGHQVTRIEVAKLDFPWLQSQADWDAGPLPYALRKAQAAIGSADHVVLIFPLWLGTVPAILKAFLEQVLRPGFAFHKKGENSPWKPGLTGKSARIIVTMGMPALWYRWFYRAHGVKGLERNILRFCGISPVRETMIGLVDAKNAAAHRKSIDLVQALGRKGV